MLEDTPSESPGNIKNASVKIERKRIRAIHLKSKALYVREKVATDDILHFQRKVHR
jgi:hypothetical protein